MSEAKPLRHWKRAQNYRLQNRSWNLTPRQNRRHRKKLRRMLKAVGVL